MRNLFIITLFMIGVVLSCKKSTPPAPVGPPIYSITATAGANGSISPDGITWSAQGYDVAYTITPNVGYYTATIIVDGASVPPTVGTSTYTFTSVQTNHKIGATFLKGAIITGLTGPNGQVPATQTVPFGSSPSLIFTPNTGYRTDSLWIDGVFAKALNGAPNYTIANIQANHTVKVSFTDALTKQQLDSLNNLLIGQWTIAKINSKLGNLQDTFLPWDVQPIAACSLNQFDQFYANGIFQRNNDPTACDPLAHPRQQWVPPPLSHWKLKNTGKVIYLIDPPLDSLTNITLTKDSLIVFFYGGFDAVRGISYHYHYARKP